jgi:hypothetical protein
MEEFEKMASLELDEPEPSPGAEPTTARTLDLDLELEEAREELVGQSFSPDISTDESSGPAQAAEELARAVGQGFIPGITSTESARALAPEVSSSNNPAEIHQAPDIPQTAETAGSIEPLSTGEAAPAAPPATEQAETENSPHGEEVHEEN